MSGGGDGTSEWMNTRHGTAGVWEHSLDMRVSVAFWDVKVEPWGVWD